MRCAVGVLFSVVKPTIHSETALNDAVFKDTVRLAGVRANVTDRLAVIGQNLLTVLATLAVLLPVITSISAGC